MNKDKIKIIKDFMIKNDRFTFSDIYTLFKPRKIVLTLQEVKELIKRFDDITENGKKLTKEINNYNGIDLTIIRGI